MPFPRPARTARVRELGGEDTALLSSYLDRHAVSAAFLRDRLEAAGHAGRTAQDARFYGLITGARGQEELGGVAFMGVNLFPHGPWDETRGAARLLVDRLYRESSLRPASVYGPARPVLAVAEQLQIHGVTPVETRAHQPLMVLTRERFEETAVSWEEPLPELGLARPENADEILRASIAMFTEEVGHSPVEPSVRGGRRYVPDARAYQARVDQLMALGRTYARIEHGEVLFKAELSSLSRQTAAVQGVWLNPRLRGQGLSAPYMRALAGQVLQRSESVSLYVNGYNYRALAAYARAGFEQAGTYATVML